MKGECSVGESEFYRDTSLREGFDMVAIAGRAAKWFASVAEDDSELLALVEHVQQEHGVTSYQASYGLMMCQHKVAMEVGEFSL